MKTLLISRSYAPAYGGCETWFKEIYGRYNPKEIHVLTINDKNCEKFDKSVLYSIHRLKNAYCLRLSYWSLKSLLKTLQLIIYSFYVIVRHKIEIIHCGSVMQPGLVAFLIKIILRIPYVVYCHGEEISEQGLKAKIQKIFKLVYNNAFKVIANSEVSKNLLKQIGVKASIIEVIKPGVDIKKFNHNINSYLAKQKYGFENNKIILTVGRLQKRKGHEFVIRAMNHILQTIPNAKYIIVGDGYEKKYILELIQQMKLQEHVVLLTSINNDELPAYYNACDVFVMPVKSVEGDTEGFGIVYLEAGACGKSVVAGRCGGSVEAVIDGQTGLLVDGGNVREIAEAIIKLLTDKKLSEKMGQNGRKRVEQENAWDFIYQKTRMLEKEVMKEREIK